MSFRELGLSELLLSTVAAEGYSEPTPIQSEAIPFLLAGRDLLGSAQTGTGKTAAFALPILDRLRNASPAAGGRRPSLRALVLSPTRELACQIGDSFRTYGGQTGLRFTTVYGGVGQVPQVRALRQGVDVLVATPGRLIDLIDQGYIDLSGVETFVLDEADRMLDMGFLPSIRQIVGKLPARRQTVLLSATMPEPIMGLANSMLRDPVRVQIKPVKETNDLIDQTVCHVARHDKPEVLAKLLDGRSIVRALVFTRTKRGADRVVKQLAQSEIRAEAIHGNKSQLVRQRALANFRARRTRILVATDIAARGIDVEGISHVFNYDLPHEPATYVHRIGRTGRAGASGIAVSLCDPDERGLLNAIERTIRRRLAVDSALRADSQSERPNRQRQPEPNAREHEGVRQNSSAPRPERIPSQGESSGGNRGQRRLLNVSQCTNEVAANTGEMIGVVPATNDQLAQTRMGRRKRRSLRRHRRPFGLKPKGSDLSQNNGTHSRNANAKATSGARRKKSVGSVPTKRRHN